MAPNKKNTDSGNLTALAMLLAVGDSDAIADSMAQQDPGNVGLGG
ncbi:hypothetical protein ACFVYJ_08880 [Pontibacter sp. JAM-7]